MGEVLPAIAPLGGDGDFPLPQSVQIGGPGQPSLTFEGPVINGLPMPGQWLLTRCVRVFGWQQQKPNFMTGAILVPTGDPLMELEYTIRLWESGTMGLFRGLLGSLFKKPLVPLGGPIPKAAALGIHDPVLKDLGVQNVVVSHVEPPLNPLVTSGGKGVWVAKVAFIEWREALPASPLPDQTIPDPGVRGLRSAASNLAAANAAVSAGATKLQSTAATALVPPR